MASPETGDRVVRGTDDEWYTHREGGQRGRPYGSWEEAMAHARRMAREEDAKLFTFEPTGEEGCFRWVEHPVR